MKTSAIHISTDESLKKKMEYQQEKGGTRKTIYEVWKSSWKIESQ